MANLFFDKDTHYSKSFLLSFENNYEVKSEQGMIFFIPRNKNEWHVNILDEMVYIKQLDLKTTEKFKESAFLKIDDKMFPFKGYQDNSYLLVKSVFENQTYGYTFNIKNAISHYYDDSSKDIVLTLLRNCIDYLNKKRNNWNKQDTEEITQPILFQVLSSTFQNSNGFNDYKVADFFTTLLINTIQEDKTLDVANLIIDNFGKLVTNFAQKDTFLKESINEIQKLSVKGLGSFIDFLTAQFNHIKIEDIALSIKKNERLYGCIEVMKKENKKEIKEFLYKTLNDILKTKSYNITTLCAKAKNIEYIINHLLGNKDLFTNKEERELFIKCSLKVQYPIFMNTIMENIGKFEPEEIVKFFDVDKKTNLLLRLLKDGKDEDILKIISIFDNIDLLSENQEGLSFMSYINSKKKYRENSDLLSIINKKYFEKEMFEAKAIKSIKI